MHDLLLASCLALALPGSLPQDPVSPPSEGWLFDSQREDGSWSAQHVPKDLPGIHAGAEAEDLWVTSLVTLAILGDGSTGTIGEDRQRVEAALKWIVRQQRSDGRIVSPSATTDLLDHAIATLALTEDRLLTGRDSEGGPAARALSYLEARALESGGWNREGAAVGTLDPRTTAWTALAIASGVDGGIEGEVDRLTHASAALITHNADRGELPARDHASELLVRLLAGEVPESRSFAASAARLVERPVLANVDGKGHDPEGVYLTTLVAYQTGGKAWKTWNSKLEPLLAASGHLDHRGPDRELACDPELTRGGSIAYTSLSLLTLEMYFRYARIIGAR